MTNYINLETNQLCTESEIRAAHPNTSFATPFNPDGYAVVHDAGQPDYDKYTQTVAQGVPIEALPNHWEQTWVVLLEPYTQQGVLQHLARLFQAIHCL